MFICDNCKKRIINPEVGPEYMNILGVDLCRKCQQKFSEKIKKEIKEGPNEPEEF